uniref:RBR-type E3 ubiquitin transferase n=1 Tax=Kryptolebias marmoratus TaxID=37003 RepID=A0A3Q3A6G8_KRYMA
MNADQDEQEDELLALQSIFGSEEFVRYESEFAGEIQVLIDLPVDFNVLLKHGKYDAISFLPPLLLTFELPADYPSSSPPSFTLTCSWLTHTQLGSLSAQLIDLYQATEGSVVLFSWIQFLREDALKLLNIHSLLELPSDQPSTMSEKQDKQDNSNTPKSEPTDVPEFVQINREDLLSQILIYNAEQKQRVFATTVFNCSVCYMDWLGSECVQLYECGHIFCRVCLRDFCKVQITEGNVQGVICPQEGCTVTPTPAQLKNLIGEELFSTYDRLLLQSTLDRMSDVTYCPRRSCSSPVISEKSSRVAMCSVCSFAFCVNCKKTYHGTNKCYEEDYKARALLEDYATGSEERRHLLESRYGKKMLLFLETNLSENWKVVNTKACPHCLSPIQKDGGCNMMWCTYCRQTFTCTLHSHCLKKKNLRFK